MPWVILSVYSYQLRKDLCTLACIGLDRDKQRTGQHLSSVHSIHHNNVLSFITKQTGQHLSSVHSIHHNIILSFITKQIQASIHFWYSKKKKKK